MCSICDIRLFVNIPLDEFIYFFHNFKEGYIICVYYDKPGIYCIIMYNYVCWRRRGYNVAFGDLLVSLWVRHS